MIGSQSGAVEFRNQNVARSELTNLLHIGNDPHRADGDLLAHGLAFHQHAARRSKLKCFEPHGGPLRDNGLGPRLDDVKLRVVIIFGPFDVHRHWMAGLRRIVFLDSDRIAGELEHLGIGQAKARTFRIRDVDVSCAAVCGADHAQLLAAERTAQNHAVTRAKRRLVDVELVRVDGTLHDVFPEAVTAGDKDDITKAGIRYPA